MEKDKYRQRPGRQREIERDTGRQREDRKSKKETEKKKEGDTKSEKDVHTLPLHQEVINTNRVP